MGKFNPGRGEVEFSAAGQSFRLVATAANIAALEVRSGAFSFLEIVRRLHGRSIQLTISALICFDELSESHNEASYKVARLSPSDILKAGTAVVEAINFQLEGPPGKESAAKTKSK